MKKPVLRKRKEGGFTIVAFALMIFTMLGFAGLAVDVGYLQLEKRKLQAAADAGAMGALREMERGNAANSSDVIAAGQNDSALNGFTDGQNNTTVAIAPPTSGTYSGATGAISATVTRVVPTFFMRVLGSSSVTISATAVAQTSTSQSSVGGCIFVMDQHDSGTFTIDGNVVLSTSCGALVNSDDSNAFVMKGGSTFNLQNGARVGVVGSGAGSGWSLANNSSLINAPGTTTELPMNVQQFTDPLTKLVAPTSPQPMQYSSTSGYVVSPGTTVTLNPGVYCGGIDVKGTATFVTGTYILAGGGLQAESAAILNDAGVGEMFYNTSSDGWGCSGKKSGVAGFTFNGTATINLVGLTQADGTGTVGVLFFDDRSSSGLTHKINGKSGSTFDGAMYFLPNYVMFAGTNQTPGFLYLVANTLELTGNSNLGSDHSTLATVNALAPSATGGGLVQ